MLINYNKSFLWLFLLSVFGFPIALFVPIILGLDTTAFSVVFRVICFLFAASLLVPKFKKSSLLFNKYFLIGFVFWIIFLIRLIYDIEIRDLLKINPYFDSPTVIYVFSIFGSFIPFCAISLRIKWIDFSRLDDLIFIACFVQCLFICVELFIFFGFNVQNIFLDRSYFVYGNEQANPLNPITISRSGCILALSSLYNYVFKNKLNFTFFITSFLIGIGLLLIGASRGPMFAFVFICFVFIVLNYSKLFEWKNLIFIIPALFLFVMFVLGFGLEAVERVSLSVDDNDRLPHWYSAYSQFLSSPILGDKIFDNHLGTYPHNIILEVLMAVGLVGFIPFIFLIIHAIKSALMSIRYQNKFVNLSILFLSYFIFSLSSSSLYTSVELWVILGSLLYVDV